MYVISKQATLSPVVLLLMFMNVEETQGLGAQPTALHVGVKGQFAEIKGCFFFLPFSLRHEGNNLLLCVLCQALIHSLVCQLAWLNMVFWRDSQTGHFKKKKGGVAQTPSHSPGMCLAPNLGYFEGYLIK